MKIFESYSEEDTRKIAFDMAVKADEGDIYCLCGDLGAGKTAFAKGFAEGLKITDDIVSPTFSIINEYMGEKNLYHFDVYRINSVQEMEDTGYEDYFYGDGVCLIEWAEMVKDIIPRNAVWISIKKDYNQSDDYRIITVE